MSDLDFVRAAGVIEVLFGLLLISGALPQVIVLAAGIPFNATLWFLRHQRARRTPTYLRSHAGAGVRVTSPTAAHDVWLGLTETHRRQEPGATP